MECNESCYYNLTHSQKRIWYIEKVNLNSPIHNIGGGLKIEEYGRLLYQSGEEIAKYSKLLPKTETALTEDFCLTKIISD